MPIGRTRKRWLILPTACCWLILLAFSALAASPKRVLVVHSFASAAPPFTTHSTAFEKELTEKMGRTVDLDEVSLDVARYATLDMEEALVELMRARQAKWQPDLVVPIGSPASVFVARHRDRLFPPATPIIYVGMDQRRLPAGALEQNATFVGESFDVPGWVEDILQIAPKTENIAVVIGASPLEQFWADVLRKEFAPFENRVNFIWLNDLSLEGILQRTRTLPPHSFIFVVLMMRDASGVTHNGDEVLQQIHAVANAPINAIFQHQLGLGIVGGRHYQAEAEGVEAARIAIRILHGAPASNFPPLIVAPLPPRYDWRELHRWKIDEKILPKGSTVLFRAPTFWQQHRTLVIAVVSFCVAQAVLISALIANLVRRRFAERSLKESEMRVALAAEAARLGVWDLNTQTSEMWISDKVRKLFGIDGATPVDRTTFERRVHPEDRAIREAAIDRAIQGGGEYDLEYRIVLPDKTVRWIHGRGRRMKDAAGMPTRFLGVAMDITDQKEAVMARNRAEEESQRQREQINLLGRASLLGEMHASLAHELRQPLAAILANASAGVRFIDQEELGELRAILSDIGAEVRRAGNIVSTVRDAIKKGSSVQGRMSLNSIITNVALMVRPDSAGYSCTVETSLAENLPLVHGDPIQMQQVLFNLVTNAFHAMGEVPVAARKVEIGTHLGENGSVRVTVRDHGTGIPEGMQERLFEQFYTTKADGLGMGLAIVRSIIEGHGGKIRADNAEGGGACFEFELPARPTGPLRPDPAHP